MKMRIHEPREETQRFVFNSVAAVMLPGLAGCSGMSTQDRNTAIGAGVGGVIGHQVSDDE